MHAAIRNREGLFPRASARGLIEAIAREDTQRREEGFRERALAASLKPQRLTHRRTRNFGFRERALAASLKLIPFPRHRHKSWSFRERALAASLKLILRSRVSVLGKV